MNRSSLAAAVLAVTLICATFAVHSDEPATREARVGTGPLRVEVDATDIAHRIFRVHEVLPVTAGTLTLHYPQWIPGQHSPAGPIEKFAGLTVRAKGEVLPWRRDEYDVYAFQVEVPQGVDTIDIRFEYLSPQDPEQGRVVMTPEMLNLQWNTVTLYPAGYGARSIQTVPSVKLPPGWQLGSALEVAARDGDTTHFRPVNYDVLVDSPIFAGQHFKRVELNPGASPPVHLNIVADEPKYLSITADQLQAHRELVRQATRLYGAHHFDHYDFLLALSNKMSGIGLEHHRSSENGVSPAYFTEWPKRWGTRDLLPHEFVHSWNGKYRRGASLATPNFNVPMNDSLLWVYEGQTQFWGQILAARSGLWSADQFREKLAAVAALYDKARPGLATWRPLQDTTNDPIIAQRKSLPYYSYQGAEDYYSGGQLVWLEVDAKLRELTDGKKGLDDFAKAFFGGNPGEWDVRTYTFADVMKVLNNLAPYNWASYLRARLDGHGSLTGGLAAHGWRLAFSDKPTEAIQADAETASLSYSLGLSANKGGAISSVVWNSPAFTAGLSPAMKIVAVNGRNYDPQILRDAVTTARGSAQPIELRVKNFDNEKTVRIEYHDGLKYPRLERIPGTPDTLSPLIAAR